MWGPSQAQWYPSPQVMQPLQQVQPMQTQPLQQVQPTQMQSGKAFIGPQYCAPFPTKFFMKDDMFSWSGEDATVVDDRGYVIFTVDAKVLSLRDHRSLKDAAGYPVCCITDERFSVCNKKYIFRGGRGFDPYPVATVNVKPQSWRGSVQVKLGDSEQVEYTFKPEGIIFGSREVNIMHQGQIIGHVTRQRSAESWFFNKQGYQLTLNAGHDHALMLSVVMIMDEYYHVTHQTQ